MSELVEIAHQICRFAHAGQTDKSGKPYYLHPEWVADHVSSDEEKILGYLHDVPEDTEFPWLALKAIFPAEVIVALDLLTHRSTDKYMDYIHKLAPNKLARAVKLVDLEHNSQLDRLSVVTEKDLERREKYAEARRYLLDFAEKEEKP